MEKTILTKAVFYIILKGLKFISKRTDNKIDDGIVEFVEGTFGL